MHSFPRGYTCGHSRESDNTAIDSSRSCNQNLYLSRSLGYYQLVVPVVAGNENRYQKGFSKINIIRTLVELQSAVCRAAGGLHEAPDDESLSFPESKIELCTVQEYWGNW